MSMSARGTDGAMTSALPLLVALLVDVSANRDAPLASPFLQWRKHGRVRAVHTAGPVSAGSTLNSPQHEMTRHVHDLRKVVWPPAWRSSGN